MEKISVKLSIVLSIITLISVVSTCCFWIHKTDELPKIIEEQKERIDEHDIRIANLEKQMAENNTKTELIYQAILEIRRAVVYNK